jgi:hypothetical protein
MKAPRVRLTVRRLLAIVALIAIVLGSFIAGVRWERQRAESQRQFEELVRRLPPPVFESQQSLQIVPASWPEHAP